MLIPSDTLKWANYGCSRMLPKLLEIQNTVCTTRWYWQWGTSPNNFYIGSLFSERSLAETIIPTIGTSHYHASLRRESCTLSLAGRCNQVDGHWKAVAYKAIYFKGRPDPSKENWGGEHNKEWKVQQTNLKLDKKKLAYAVDVLYITVFYIFPFLFRVIAKWFSVRVRPCTKAMYG